MSAAADATAGSTSAAGAAVGEGLRLLAALALENCPDRELLERALAAVAGFSWSAPPRLLSAFLLGRSLGIAAARRAASATPRRTAPRWCWRSPPRDGASANFAWSSRRGGVPTGLEHSFLEAAAAILAGGLLRRRVVGEQRRLETAFLQAQRMEAVGRLAGGVAHDFNNILTTITNYADLGLMKLPAGAPLCRNFEEILASVERATLLTQQLLAFSRRQVVEPRLLDLDAILAEMGKMLRRLLGADVELRIEAGVGTARVFADPALIEQAVINLALAARDAMPRGGTPAPLHHGRAARRSRGHRQRRSAGPRLRAGGGGAPGARDGVRCPGRASGGRPRPGRRDRNRATDRWRAAGARRARRRHVGPPHLSRRARGGAHRPGAGASRTARGHGNHPAGRGRRLGPHRRGRSPARPGLPGPRGARGARGA